MWNCGYPDIDYPGLAGVWIVANLAVLKTTAPHDRPMGIPMIGMPGLDNSRSRQVISNLRQPVSVPRIYWYDRVIAVEVTISCQLTKCGVAAQRASDCHSPAIRQP
jgi:hypothetical protein